MTATAKPERTVSGVLLRWLGQTLLAALILLALVYIGDYLIYLARGKPQDQLILNQYMSAPLKGNKTEYYYEGTGPVSCSKTLFPQGGLAPCWKLRNHPSISEEP